MKSTFGFQDAAALGIYVGILSLISVHAVRAQECSTDADCETGFHCDLSPQTTIGCDPSAGPCVDTTPTTDPTGNCEPTPIQCDTNADCPNGLSCEVQEQSDCISATNLGPAVDGGVEVVDDGCPAPAPPTSECVLALVDCQTDLDCGPDELCTQAGTHGACSNVSPPPCTPGESCAPPPAAECTETPFYLCLPKPFDCSAGQACLGDTRCVPLPSDARDSAPVGWDVDALCLPEGFALLFEGRVTATQTGGADSTARGTTNSAADEVANSNGATHSSASNGSQAIGCTVSAANRDTSYFAAFAALACASLLARRRRWL